MQPKHLALIFLMANFAACGAKDRSDDDESGENTESARGDMSERDASGEPMTRSDAGTGRADAGKTSCPGARPSESTACETDELCTYDEIECTCESGLWSCEEPVNPDCPSTTPTSGSTCELPEATECDYLEQECECLEGKWSCESEDADEEPLDGGVSDSGAADASEPSKPDAAGGCPELRPAERTSCTRSTMTCTYEDTQCTCPNGNWSCTEPVVRGCPETAPLHGDPCVGRADCDFLEVECECLRNAWSCKPND